MCRSSDIRPVKKAFLLICEGAKTEPNFFAAFREDKEKCKVEGEFKIQPKPTLEQEDIDVQLNRGDTIRKKRYLKETESKEETIAFSGPQPLNWVKAGIINLDTYEEVWCVFDKDEHPKRKDAFELVEEQRQKGKNIHIAFSSRCIEYYFLLHFEYLYKAFEKSECNEKINGKTRTFHCCLPDAVPGKACHGERCTNGYARRKGYWEDSKGDKSLYPILKDKLFFAIRNAELVRRRSSQENPDIPFYDRNPYVTTDLLMARLLGYTILSVGKPLSLKEGSTTLKISKVEDKIVIFNTGDVSFAVQKDFIQHLNYMTGEIVESSCEARILRPGEKCQVTLKGEPGELFKINSLRRSCLLVL